MTGSGFDPHDPAVDRLLTSLAGRPLVASDNRTRGRCQRCERKNAIRRQVDTDDRRDPTFEDGDRVRLDAVARPPDGTLPDVGRPPERAWAVTAVYHLDHPMCPRAATARPDRVQARATATVRADGWVYSVGDDPAEVERDVEALVTYDPTVEWVSPVDEGTPAAPPEDTSDGPVTLDPTDPRPDWPTVENDWRETLVCDRGDHSGSG
jgi:hypothetical protein